MNPSKLKNFLALPFYDKLNVAQHIFYRLKSLLFYRWVFKSFGQRSVIYAPTLIGMPRFIHIGEGVLIRQGVRLEAVTLDPDHPPEIRIDDNVSIEQDVHIVALGRVHIRKSATLAARTSLLCGNHPFLDIDGPTKISDRLEGGQSFIEIGEGSLIGVGSIIHMNVRIGKHVVVGANSVVKRSVPSFSAVSGNPAAVVLRYNEASDRWESPKKVT